MINRKRLIKRGLAFLLSLIMAFEPATVAFAADTVSDNSVMIVEDYEESDEQGEELTDEESATEESAAEESAGEESDSDSVSDSDEETDEETDEDAVSDNEAEEETDEDAVSDNEADEETDEDTVSDNEADEEVEVTEEEDSNVVSELPSYYVLSEEQKTIKSNMANMVADFNSAREGVDYAEGQVYFFADTREEAEMVASAIKGELISYTSTVALVQLSTTTVEDVFNASRDVDFNLPAITPNYYSYIDGYVFDDEEVDAQVVETVLEEDEAAEDEVDCIIDEEDIVYEDDDIVIGEEIIENDDSDEYYEESMDYAPYQKYSDPYLKPDSSQYQYHLASVGAAYLWNKNYNGSGVTIGVIDSGCVTGHADLPTITSKLKTYGAGDPNGHGSHVVGSIVAKADGNYGVGVAPGATVYIYRVANNNSQEGGKGQLDNAAIAAAITQSATDGCEIVNMSFGSPIYDANEESKIRTAYNAGVIMFASAGNSGGNDYNYPASFNKYVISVGALNPDNTKANFSTFGGHVDVCAPGVRIWSTYNSNTTSYACLDGTSMASPIMAGEAAIILQAVKNGYFSDVQSNKGVKRTEQFIKLLKNKAISVPGGMGAGRIYLPKVFGIGSSTMKPGVPTITMSSGTVQDKQVGITISAPAGTTIRYMVNGKVPKLFDTTGKTVVVNGSSYTFNVAPTGSKTSFVVSAMAVNDVGQCSNIVVKTFQLKTRVTGITFDKTKCVTNLVAGKSATLTATVAPASAYNKAVKWIFVNGTSSTATNVTKANEKMGLTVSQTGVVTATTKVKPGTYYVRAVAKDGSGVTATWTIEVKPKSETKYSKVAVVNPTKSITIKRFEDNVTEDVLDTNRLILKTKFETASASDFLWSSSNTTIATVDTGKVTFLNPGTVKIRVTAKDNSCPPVTITYIVKQKATGISSFAVSGVTANEGYVEKGKSLPIKAEVQPANVSVKKVKWSIVDKPAGSHVKVTDTGVFVAEKNAVAGTYTVRATTTDGTNISEDFSVTVIEKSITSMKFDSTSTNVFRVGGRTNISTSTTVKLTVTGFNLNNYTSTTYKKYFALTNSNPALVDASFAGYDPAEDGRKATITVKVTSTGVRHGNVVLTVKALTGKGFSAATTIKVVNPASGLTLNTSTMAADSVPNGGSVKIKATFANDYGPVGSTELVWKVTLAEPYEPLDPSNPVEKDAYDKAVKVYEANLKCISINKSGKLSVSSKFKFLDNYPEMNYITVSASTVDGSRCVAKMEICVVTNVGDARVALWNPSTYENAPDTIDIYTSRYNYVARTYAVEFADGRWDYAKVFFGTTSVITSNQKVAYAYNSKAEDAQGNVRSVINIIPVGKGECTLTIQIKDGTPGGKSCTYRVVVH